MSVSTNCNGDYHADCIMHGCECECHVAIPPKPETMSHQKDVMSVYPKAKLIEDGMLYTVLTGTGALIALGRGTTKELAWEAAAVNVSRQVTPPKAAEEAQEIECAASDSGCSYGPYGPKGEVQCRWCGEPKPAPQVEQLPSCEECDGPMEFKLLCAHCGAAKSAEFDELWKELIADAEVEPSPEEEGFARWGWNATKSQSLPVVEKLVSLDEVLTLIENEPVLPVELPDEIKQRLNGLYLELALRLAVVATKNSLTHKLRKLSAEKETGR